MEKGAKAAIFHRVPAISDNEVVTSYGPPRSLLDATAHFYKRSCPSVGRSMRPYIDSVFFSYKQN